MNLIVRKCSSGGFEIFDFNFSSKALSKPNMTSTVIQKPTNTKEEVNEESKHCHKYKLSTAINIHESKNESKYATNANEKAR